MSRILVVDDDDDLLRIIGEYLSANGFETELAGSVAQARNCLVRSNYDAILSDFQMPGESGLDLLSHVRERDPGLPFIMMTGSYSARLKHEAMKMGSSGYIEKPFQLRDLVETITTARHSALHHPAIHENDHPCEQRYSSEDQPLPVIVSPAFS